MDTDSDHDDSYGFPSQESSTETFTPTPEGSCKNCKNTDFEANSGAFYCTNCGYEEGPELVYDLYGTTSVYHGNWPENNENAINENLENLKAGDVIPQMGGEDGSSTLEKSGGSLRSQYGTLKEGSVGHGKSGGPQWHVDSQESSTETPAAAPYPVRPARNQPYLDFEKRWRRQWQRRRAAIIGALPGLGARAAPVAPL